jgi:FMN phosphatase YigB (HAD superfamily)
MLKNTTISWALYSGFQKNRIPISDICLVSSNLWDIAGGQAAGMQTCWINIGEEVKASEELDVIPDYIFNTIENVVLSS